jgi:ATP-dependent helicase HrpA
VRVLATAAEQGSAMRRGTRRLIRLSVASPVKAVERQLAPRQRLALGSNPDGSLSALLNDCADAAVDSLAAEPVWTRGEFAAQRDRVAASLVATTADIVGRVEAALSAAHDVQLLLPTRPPATQADAIADIRSQLDRLLPAGFVTATGRAHLADLTRYLTAIGRRLDRLPQAIEADRERMQRVAAVQRAYDDLVGALPVARASAPDVRGIARQLEELRVSLWAQQLGTPRPVSEQRILRAIDSVRDNL